MSLDAPISDVSAVMLPAERFYWAVLELDQPLSAQPWRMRWESRRRQEEWLYRFEEVLPVPIEQVQAVFRIVGPRRILACGMEREILNKYRHEGVLELGPKALPSYLTSSGIAHQRINLMTGAMTPPALVASRQRWIHAACWWLCLGLLGLSLGLLRRAGVNFEAAASSLTDAEALIRVGLAEGQLPTTPGAAALPPELQLTAELRKLRQTRTQPSRLTQASVGADDSLVALLQSWPSGEGLQTEFIGVTPTALSVAGVVEDSAVAAQWSQGFASIPGWRLEQPEMSGNAGSTVRLALRWTPAPMESDSSGTPDSPRAQRENSQ